MLGTALQPWGDVGQSPHSPLPGRGRVQPCPRAPQAPGFTPSPPFRPPPRCHSPARRCQPCPGSSTVLNKRVTVPNMLMGKCLRCSGGSFPTSGNACAQQPVENPRVWGSRGCRQPQRCWSRGAVPAAALAAPAGEFAGMDAVLGASRSSQAAMGQEQRWGILWVRICCEKRLYLFSETPALSRDLQRCLWQCWVCLGVPVSVPALGTAGRTWGRRAITTCKTLSECIQGGVFLRFSPLK